MMLIQAGYPDTEVSTIRQAQSMFVYRYKSSRDTKEAIAARAARKGRGYSYTARVIDDVNKKYYVLELACTLLKQIDLSKEN